MNLVSRCAARLGLAVLKCVRCFGVGHQVIVIHLPVIHSNLAMKINRQKVNIIDMHGHSYTRKRNVISSMFQLRSLIVNITGQTRILPFDTQVMRTKRQRYYGGHCGRKRPFTVCHLLLKFYMESVIPRLNTIQSVTTLFFLFGLSIYKHALRINLLLLKWQPLLKIRNPS